MPLHMLLEVLLVFWWPMPCHIMYEAGVKLYGCYWCSFAFGLLRMSEIIAFVRGGDIGRLSVVKLGGREKGGRIGGDFFFSKAARSDATRLYVVPSVSVEQYQRLV